MEKLQQSVNEVVLAYFR